jgi:hypothetical protein
MIRSKYIGNQTKSLRTEAVMMTCDGCYISIVSVTPSSILIVGESNLNAPQNHLAYFWCTCKINQRVAHLLFSSLNVVSFLL